MKPRDLALSRIREHALPALESQGFRFSASQLRFSRSSVSGKEFIQIQLNRHNSEGDVTFWTIWCGVADWNLPGWTQQGPKHVHLDGTEADTAVMAEFVRNVNGPGRRFLDFIRAGGKAALPLSY